MYMFGSNQHWILCFPSHAASRGLAAHSTAAEGIWAVGPSRGVAETEAAAGGRQLTMHK